MGACAVHPSFYSALPEIVKGCISNNIMINPYTVDNPENIKALASAGVSGIITNVPDVALKILSGMEA